MRLYFFSIVFLIFSSVVFGQVSAPKYSNEFLAIGVGARALGMSGAQTAITNDVTAAYWNPAGLLNITNKYEVSLMHSEYFAGIAKYDYAGFATQIDSNSVLAVSAIRFGTDDIADTRYLYDANGALNYNNVRFFSVADYAFLFSYARRLPMIKGLKLGANFKVIHRNVDIFATAWGFGLDAGVQYEYKKWQFGVTGRDITGTFNAWSHNVSAVSDVYTQTGNEIPQNSIEVTLPKLLVGVARNFQFGKKFGMLASAQVDLTFDGRRNALIQTDLISGDPNLGIELNYKQMVFLRGGVGNVQKIKDFNDKTYTSVQPNFGVGLKINRFYIDYALTNIGNSANSLYSNVFSLKATFN